MKVDRSAYEWELYEALGVSNLVQSIDQQTKDAFKSTEPATPNLDLAVDAAANEVTVRTSCEGRAYDLTWHVEISAAEGHVYPERVNVTDDSVTYAVPSGECEVVADARYQTGDEHVTETFRQMVDVP